MAGVTVIKPHETALPPLLTPPQSELCSLLLPGRILYLHHSRHVAYSSSNDIQWLPLKPNAPLLMSVLPQKSNKLWSQSFIKNIDCPEKERVARGLFYWMWWGIAEREMKFPAKDFHMTQTYLIHRSCKHFAASNLRECCDNERESKASEFEYVRKRWMPTCRISEPCDLSHESSHIQPLLVFCSLTWVVLMARQISFLPEDRLYKKQ